MLVGSNESVPGILPSSKGRGASPSPFPFSYLLTCYKFTLCVSSVVCISLVPRVPEADFEAESESVSESESESEFESECFAMCRSVLEAARGAEHDVLRGPAAGVPAPVA